MGILWGDSIGDWWIPLIKGRELGKCFHIMTSLFLIKMAATSMTVIKKKILSCWIYFAKHDEHVWIIFYHLNTEIAQVFEYQSHDTLRWRQNGRDSVSNHQPHDCLLNRLFRRRSKKTSKLRITGLCVGNSPVPGEFPTQMASNAENVSIWWRHHEWFVYPVNCWHSADVGNLGISGICIVHVFLK